MTPSDIRRKLLSNGFTPLPAVGKATMLTGWPDLKVTLTEIAQWEEHYDWMPSTGIRCDGLVAVDIDVTDATMAKEIYRLARDLGPGAIARVGQAPKVLLLFRSTRGASGRKGEAGRYVDAESAIHNIEILRGKGCQFLADGVHPKTGLPYTWVGGSPLGKKRKDLPPLGETTIRDFLDEVRKLFAERGWQKEQRQRPDGVGQGDFPRVYDLRDDTVIDVVKPEDWVGPWAAVELEKALRDRDSKATLRCTLSCFREEADGANGQVGLCEDRFLRVTDHRDKIVHLRPDIDRRADLTLEQRAEIVGEAEAWFNTLCTDFAYVATEDKSYRLAAPTNEGYTDTSLRRYTRNVDFEDENVVAKWMHSKEAHRCDARKFSPRHHDQRVFREGELKLVNLYVPPRWGSVRADLHGLETFHEYLTHLLPVEREREFFLDWLANKVQRPADRMCGILMVADGIFGTGRGTMHSLMVRLWGPQYVKSPPFDIISGKSNQGQYYDYLYETLIVTVPEVLQDEHGWHARRGLFDRLKAVVDPGSTDGAHLPRKMRKTATTEVFASFFLATNHTDALVLAQNDRRFAVLENGRPMPPSMIKKIYGPGGLLNDDGKTAAVYQWLASRDVRANVFEAPLTAAKTRMVERGKSDLDEVFAEFMSYVQPKCFAQRHFLFFCTLYGESHDVDLPEALDIKAAIRKGFWAAQGCASDRSTRARHCFRNHTQQDRVVLASGVERSEIELVRELDETAKRLLTFAKSVKVEA